MRPRGWESGKPLKVRLRASDGPSLLALGCEIVWATAWEDDANEWIGPRIGLPRLDFINWNTKNTWTPERLHWKTKRILHWMAYNRPEVPFIWIDDEVIRRDRDFIQENYSPDSTTLKVPPDKGLIDEHFKTIADWKNSVSS